MTDANDETNPSIEPAALTEGEVAKSMVCNECGKKFRSMAQAQAHAERTYNPSYPAGEDYILIFGIENIQILQNQQKKLHR